MKINDLTVTVAGGSSGHGVATVTRLNDLQGLGRPEECAGLAEFPFQLDHVNGESLRADGAVSMAPRANLRSS